MAVRSHPVGPFPEGAEPDAYDRRRRRVLWSLPSGLYVLGTRAGQRRNLMTLNWAGQVSVEPKLVAVSVESGAFSNELARQGRVFSLNILAREDRALVRKFVKPLPQDDPSDGDPSHGDPSHGDPSHGDPGTVLAGFAVTVAATGAPILEAAAAWLDCRVTETLELGSHTLFLGEVVDCSDVADDLEVLRMEDTRMSYGG